ncbi:MAG: ABC transporter substrate-binding protein [Capsulimonas sp.]|uniref:ABC transporter substrate-binding protein n=1 Tax=Capsulimonas sp. TaxID=2494211 RepID=UPI0032669259
MHSIRTSKFARLAFTIVPLGLMLTACAPKAQQTATSTTPGAPAASTEPITIGYSDWPGWTCWDIADQQGFFKKHNVNVKLVWFPNYTDSLNALAAEKVDANCQTWSDTMGPLAQGQALKAVLINDNSAGNDAVVAKAGITSIKDLKGKKVATELGTVEQFLLDQALAANGMTEKDIQYVNIKVQDCPAAMLSGKIDACAVWEPNKSQLLKSFPGSTVIFDSKQLSGLIPDLLVFQSKVVSARPADIQNIVDAWYDALDWWRAHPVDAVKIMAKRTDSPVDFYTGFIQGTRIFSAPEAQAAFTKSDKATSLYKSAPVIGDFLVGQKQIPKTPDFAAAIDDTFVKAAVAKGEGKLPPYDYALKVD